MRSSELSSGPELLRCPRRAASIARLENGELPHSTKFSLSIQRLRHHVIGTDGHPHTPCPSAGAVADQAAQGFVARLALGAHHRPGREKARTLWLFEHPRQPYESWWSIRLGIFRWLEVRFF